MSSELLKAQQQFRCTVTITLTCTINFLLLWS